MTDEEKRRQRREYYQANKERKKALQARRRLEHPDKIKEEGLWSRFRIRMSDYNFMRAEQGGLCAICKKPEQVIRGGRVKALAVDHCHVTGIVRGLLCHRCNVMLGQVRDSTEILTCAIEYLKRSRK